MKSKIKKLCQYNSHGKKETEEELSSIYIREMKKKEQREEEEKNEMHKMLLGHRTLM